MLLLASPTQAQEGSAFSWKLASTLSKGNTHTERFYEWGKPPVITVCIGGKKYRFLLDTGAPTVISDRILTAGKPLSNLNSFAHLGTVGVTDALGHRTQTEVVRMTQIALGLIKLQGVPALIYPASNPILQQLNVDGILGSNALAGLTVTFSAKQNRISFTAGSTLSNTSSLPLNLHLDAQGTPAIPVRLASNAPAFFLFDSGFEGLCDLAPAAAQNFGSAQAVAVRLLLAGGGYTGINGGSANGESVHLPELAIGTAVLENVTASVTGDSHSKIGAALLTAGEVTLDYVAARFLFAPYRR